MTKHFANNSVLRRASQFENLNHDQSNNGTQPEGGNSVGSGSIKRSSLPRKDETSTQNSNANNDHFINTAFGRFQREYASLYPDSPLPFEELHSLHEAKEHLKAQQQRIGDLSKEINKAKFSAKFLQEIISHNEKKDFGMIIMR